MNTIPEQLGEAQSAADKAARMLQAALRTASAVEALLILQLIERAAALAHGIKALQGARGEK